ncbi:MAG: hypothetical protein PHY80_06585 [Rickettsiales bacterium]|nr:hypothetical protein [Rickettsiales bacterium]
MEFEFYNYSDVFKSDDSFKGFSMNDDVRTVSFVSNFVFLSLCKEVAVVLPVSEILK